MIGVDGQHLSTLGPQIGHVSNSPETGLHSLFGADAFETGIAQAERPK